MKRSEDWAADIQQAMDYDSTQYDRAIMVGIYVQMNGLSNNVIFTGHSLGGGLAAAATFFATPWNNSMPTRKMAYTFNAAHFFRETGLKFIDIHNLPQNSVYGYLNPYSFGNAFAKSSQLIDAYIVEGEIVDALQTKFLDNHRANGKRIILEKPNETLGELPDVVGISNTPFPILNNVVNEFLTFCKRLRKKIGDVLDKFQYDLLSNRIERHKCKKVIEYLQEGIRRPVE